MQTMKGIITVRLSDLQQIEYPNQEAWLLGRAGTIGASDVATILGINPYKSAYTLWAEKTGVLEPWAGNIATRVGHALENLVTELYEEETGFDCLDLGDFTVFCHPVLPYFRCTPDRVVMDGGKLLRVVELKTMGERAAAELQEGETPLAYQVQLQAQMAIMGAEDGDLAVLVGNRHFFCVPFQRHDSLIDSMLEKVAEFQARVENLEPPDLDDTESTYRTLQRLHPEDNGQTVILPLEAIDAAAQLAIVKEKQKLLDAEELRCKNVLLSAIGPATFAEGGGLRLSLKTQERAGSIKADLKYEAALLAAGVEFKKTDATKTRVLRTMKAS